MKRFLAPVRFVAAVLVCTSSGSIVASDDVPVSQGELTVREQAETAVFAAAELKRWEFVLHDSDQTRVTVTPSPVTRWAYFDSGRYYGNVYVCTANGRPQAIFSLFRWCLPMQGSYFTGTSLSDIPITATRIGQPLWTPRKSNLEMSLFQDGPPPGKNLGARLVQLRHLARRFNGDVSDRLSSGQDSVKPLRLLPQPVFRYGRESSDVLDGAIFAFASGSTPAVFLIIEAVVVDDEVQWQYGIARHWTYKARVFLNGKVVWSVDEVNPSADPNASMYLAKISERQ